ncbi:MAG: V-type ATP synthase subunit E [Dysosmobacter sp.]
MMNGIDTIIQRLNIDAKAETDALLEKARQEAAAVAARYQAQADKEAADLAARNERLAAEREERLISAAQMEARKTVLAAKQAVMEETYAKALEKLRNLSETRYVEVLTELLLQAAPHGVGEVLSLRPGSGNGWAGRGGRCQRKVRRQADPLRRDRAHSGGLHPQGRQR